MPDQQQYATKTVRLLMPGDVVIENGKKYRVKEVRHTEYTTRVFFKDATFWVYDAPDREERVYVDRPAMVRKRRGKQETDDGPLSLVTM